MSNERINAYAEAVLNLARAEDAISVVEDEFFRFGRIVDGNEELKSTLTDPRIPAARRQQIVEDILQGSASDVTLSAVSMIVAAGRGGDLPKIANELAKRTARTSGAEVAEVRSAVALTQEQIDRLGEALTSKLGHPVTVKNIVDPSVLGGIVTQIGDSVLDGTVRTRLSQVREAF